MNLRDVFDLGMLSAIFFMTAIELSSFYFQHKYDTYLCSDNNPYLFYYMPLLSSLTILFASSFFLFRILRFKACIYTQIITITYFIDQLFTTVLIYIGYNEDWYFKFIYPLYFITIFGIFIYLIYGRTLKHLKNK